MGRNRGKITKSQKEIVKCIDCKRKYTKFMSIKISQYTNEHKCIKCYNGGNNGQENDIRIVFSRRYVERMYGTKF